MWKLELGTPICYKLMYSQVFSWILVYLAAPDLPVYLCCKPNGAMNKIVLHIQVRNMYYRKMYVRIDLCLRIC
jgi:hypothetical protein